MRRHFLQRWWEIEDLLGWAFAQRVGEPLSRGSAVHDRGLCRPVGTGVLVLRRVLSALHLVDRPVPGRNSVATDNFYGGQLAARHLLSLGHRCFGLLCGEAKIRNAADRIEGFRSELKLSGLDVSPDYVVHGRQELDLGIRISELLEKNPRPTAVFATSGPTPRARTASYKSRLSRK